ncbi:MAG: S9 family peptidase [Armatimonadetes bacterium]|nr:S9 family peptidase [Armatimonadota bacterium]MDE2206593.1 S9 family peptidase [Armatimonadota bacterium]
MEKRGPIHYPAAPRGTVVDEYGAVRVPDPYRWLEDANSPETHAWIEAENQLTFGWLDKVPGRARILHRLQKLWNYERYGMPEHRAGHYFFSKNDGLQNQAVLYTSYGLKGEPRVLIDPNKLSADGTVALGSIVPSWDGKYIAYSVQSAGSDWMEWKVRDVATGEDTSDDIKWSKFSGASWTHDNRGFFYSAYDAPDPQAKLQAANYYQKLYYHRLGTPQSADTLIYQSKKNKDWGFDGSVTDDGHYLIITVWVGTETRNRVYYQDLGNPLQPSIPAGGGKVVKLLDGFDAQYNFIGNVGPKFFFSTDLGAPMKRVISIDIQHPEARHTVVAEQSDAIDGASMVGGRIIVSYLKDASSRVRIFSETGAPAGEIKLPAIGYATGFSGTSLDKETFYSFTSFTRPNTIYRYDIATGRSYLYKRPTVDFEPANYVVRQVFYHSKDGTRVPMFLVYKKGVVRNGKNPVYLYGYGGFDISITPFFSPSIPVWLDMGGIFAVANIRGGGEYGEAWHKAGMKHKKQNVFDDFIAAAQWLISNRYTSTPKLSIGGGSNGGLLVGACETQRPDLFAAAVPEVGVMDMLRFNKFTIGWGWQSEYGSPENPADFKVLRAYSPLQNIHKGTHYPATLVTTSDHDDRVVPAHSFKFTAEMQWAQAGPNPVLIRIETRAGHGGGKPISKILEETADRWAFLSKVLDVPVPKEW